jgi:hypothetical protein
VIGTSQTRLITLRGNSGVGKTTVARALQASRPRGEVALLSQDVVRREVLGARDAPGNPAIDLLDLMAPGSLSNAVSPWCWKESWFPRGTATSSAAWPAIIEE